MQADILRRRRCPDAQEEIAIAAEQQESRRRLHAAAIAEWKLEDRSALQRFGQVRMFVFGRQAINEMDIVR